MVLDVMLAEGEGFEPSIRFPVYTLSRRAPSTTRPPLQHGRGLRPVASAIVIVKMTAPRRSGQFAERVVYRQNAEQCKSVARGRRIGRPLRPRARSRDLRALA